MNRIQWIDISKGIGIFIVVLGHTLRNDISLIYIYGFHMPLFFFLSGIVYKEKEYDFATLIKKRFNSLIIPYLFFYLLTYLYWIFIEHNFRTVELEWWQPLLGLLYGSQWHKLMDHNGILWFLPCLFTIEVLYYLLLKLSKNRISICFIFVLFLCVIGFSVHENLPWGINTAFVAIQFFFIGNISRSYLVKNQSVMSETILAAFFLFLYVLGQMHIKNKVSMAFAEYGNIIAFEFFAFLGLFVIILFSKTINDASLKFKSNSKENHSLNIYVKNISFGLINCLLGGGKFSRKKYHNNLCATSTLSKNLQVFRQLVI